MTISVIKISGHELDDLAFVSEFARTIADIAAREALVIVHGGGKEITSLQTRLGIVPQMAEGQRITDAESLSVVEMVLAGAINKRLVRLLVNAGVDALGMTGVDRGLVRARKLEHSSIDYGYTGSVESVNSDVLLSLLEMGLIPVIAPIGLGYEHNYNVNADVMAGALASAVSADRLVFLSNVAGVLRDGAIMPSLTRSEAEAMIADGTIFGGMIPKVHTALAALSGGVERVAITDLNGLRSHGGTVMFDDTEHR